MNEQKLSVQHFHLKMRESSVKRLPHCFVDLEIKVVTFPLTILTADSHYFLLPPMYHSHTKSALLKGNFDFLQSTTSTTMMCGHTGATQTWPSFSDHVPCGVYI